MKKKGTSLKDLEENKSKNKKCRLIRLKSIRCKISWKKYPNHTKPHQHTRTVT